MFKLAAGLFVQAAAESTSVPPMDMQFQVNSEKAVQGLDEDASLHGRELQLFPEEINKLPCSDCCDNKFSRGNQ